MNILLVDDTAGVRESVGAMLELRGYGVIYAATSQEALVYLTDGDLTYEGIQVMLTDYDLGMLSEQDGAELCFEVKRIEPTIATILWSGIRRDTCDDADFQCIKTDPVEVIEWLANEQAMREGR